MLKEISLDVKNTNPFRELASKFRCQVNVVDCKETGFDSTNLLLEVSGENSEQLIGELKEIREVRTVYSSRPMQKSGKGSFLVIINTRMLFYCGLAQSSGGFCISCPYVSTEFSNGTVPWKLFITSLGSMGTIVDALEKNGIAGELSVISHASPGEMLTARQREVLLKASELGYFSFPRKMSLTEVAGQMSIAPATLSEILRSAEAKIMRHYVDHIVKHNLD
jgi:predicted DNA binding protein